MTILLGIAALALPFGIFMAMFNDTSEPIITTISNAIMISFIALVAIHSLTTILTASRHMKTDKDSRVAFYSSLALVLGFALLVALIFTVNHLAQQRPEGAMFIPSNDPASQVEKLAYVVGLNVIPALTLLSGIMSIKLIRKNIKKTPAQVK